MAGTSSLAFEFDYSARRERAWQAAEKLSEPNGCLLVSNLVNIRYLTGFSGSSAFLLLAPGREILLTDGRYVDQVASECPDLETEIRPVDSTMQILVAESMKRLDCGRCLIESDAMTRTFYRQLESSLGGDVELIDSSGLIENLRSIKDDAELALIRKAVEINEAALQATLAKIDRDWTELNFARQLEHQIRELGGDGFAFDAIVAAGPASALPHYHPGDTRIFDHDFFLVDWGSDFKSYASDLTRMVCVGAVPPKIAEIHEIVAQAKQAAAEALRPGAELKAVDSAARSVIAAAGYEAQFNHGLGHSFGLEIHESPFMSPAFEGTFSAGTAVTIEPGIYLAGIGGVRLEDDFLVTQNGCEKLNHLPDDFLTI